MVGPKEGGCGQEPSSLRATRYYGWSQGCGQEPSSLRATRYYMVGPKEGGCGQEPSSLRATRYYGWSRMWARAFLPKGQLGIMVGPKEGGCGQKPSSLYLSTNILCTSVPSVNLEDRLKPIWLPDVSCVGAPPSLSNCSVVRPVGYSSGCPQIFAVDCRK